MPTTLPPELLEQIISTAWDSPLTTRERITLMTSSALVSKPWSALFTHLSSTTAHIPCPAYLPRFLRLTRIESLYTRTRAPHEARCRAIHLAIANPHVHPPAPAPSTSAHPYARAAAAQPPMAATLSELIFTLSAYPGGFPRLRTLALSFTDVGFHDILAHHRFFRFPGQVTRLELRFAFAAHTPAWLVRALRADQGRRGGMLYPFVPSVRSLVVCGASDAFVVDMLRTCRDLETLEVDFPEGSPALGAGASEGAEPRLLRLREVGPGDGEGVAPLIRLVIADTCKDDWEGRKVDPESDLYRFHRVK